MKAANYRYLEFISSFDDHSNGIRNSTKAASPVAENGRSCRRLNFFAERVLQVLEVISRGEYMTFGVQGKDIRPYPGDISASSMSRIFGKKIIAAGLTIRNLVLIPTLA